MLLTNWLRSISSRIRPFRQLHNKRRARSRYGTHAILNHQRRPVTVEELEDRTLLTSMISINDKSSVEGNDGITTFYFTVTRTGTNAGDLNEDLAIDFTTQDGSANSAVNDYLTQTGTLNFAADATSTKQTKSIQIQVLGDYTEEGDESFQVILSTQMSGVTFIKDTGIGIIYDDEYRRVEETLQLSPPAPVSDGDHFGQILEVDGDYMVVGVPDSDLVASDAGAVFIYERNRQGTADETDDTWSYSTTLTAFDGAADDHFGSSIAISGDTIVIGAFGADLNQSNEGAAYVFRLTSGEWQLESKLTASDAEADDSFGTDVAIENDLIVIGAPLHDVPSYNNSGAAYIFTRSDSIWSEDQILTETEFYSSDNNLGRSVAIENGEVFVAARRAKVDYYGASVGSIFTYQNNAGTWEKQQQLPLTFSNETYNVVSDLVVSGNHLAIIGAEYFGNTVFLFENTDGTWEFQQIVSSVPSDMKINSIDLTGTSLVVGSVRQYSAADYSGAVAEYQLIRDRWIRTENYYGSSTDLLTGFGTEVVRADSQIIVGEPKADAAALDSGLIRVLGPFIPGYEISDVSKYEGDSGQTLFEFTIERKASEAGDLNFASSISYTTADGTATVADGDYQAQSGVLNFAADPNALSQTQTVTIVVNGDETYEGREYFSLQLSNPTNGAQLFDALGEGTIEPDDKAIVGFTESEITVNETEGKAWITLQLDKVFSEDVTVPLYYEEGTAEAPDDFGISSLTVTIPAGQLTATFSVDIVDDALVEDSEDFQIFLGAHDEDNFRTSSNYKSTITINNDDLIEISIEDVVVSESQTYAYLTLTASQLVTLPLIFHFTTQDNTATSPDDYTGYADIFVRFAGGDQTSQQLKIPIIDDLEWESDESFLVNLTYVTGYNIDVPPVVFVDRQAEVTIIDNDRPAVFINDITVDEDAGSATLTVNLNKVAPDPVTVDYVTTDQTAIQPDDYTSVSGTLTFAPGETSKTINIPIINSAFSEPTETFAVNLSNLASDGTQFPIYDSKSVVTIIDEDYYTLTIAHQNVNEADGSVDVTVSLDKVLPTAMTVDYSTLDYTADAGIDYQSTSGTLSFDPGEISKTITIPIIDDYLAEYLEKFFVKLSNLQANGSNVSITMDQAVVNIHDEDQYYLTIGDQTVSEADGTASLTVTLDHALAKTLTVDYTTQDQTAHTGSDFSSVSGTLTFAPGELTQTISVPLIDGNTVESLETFLVNLSNPLTDGGEISFTQSQAQVSITDDEFASISIYDVSVDEEQGTAVLTVTLNQPVDAIVNVGFATAEQSATEGQDYQHQSGTLVFEPGETSKELHIIFTNDDIVEFSETFLVNLSLKNQVNTTNIQLSDSQGEITILDHDQCIITINDVTVDEQEGSAKVRVSISNRVSSIISFDCTTIDQTASSSEDYTSITQTRTISSNVTGLYITIPVIDDTILEDPETLLLQISNLQTHGANVILEDDQAVITIYDSLDTQIQIQDFTVDENAEEAIVNITLTAPIDVTVSIDYTTVDGTARDTSDYLARSGTLIFLAGETSKTVAVPLVYSPMVELNKSFQFQISNFLINGIENPIADNEAEIEIRDRDSARINVPEDFSVQESDGSATVTITMNRPASTAVQFNYFLIQVSADVSEDYTDVSGTLIFNPGEQTKSFTVPILEDELIEADETFRVILNRLVRSDTDINLDDFACNITIIDNDVGTLSIDDLTVREDAGYFYVNLSLTKALGTNLYVFYELVDVTATQPEDYAPRSDRVELIAGYLTRSFSFILKEDTIKEDTETFQINLLSITYSDMYGLTLGDSTATITILDDDHPLISIQDIYVDEDAGEAVVTVSSSLPPTSAFSVDFATSSDTALIDADYLAQSGTLTFDVGEQTKTISISIVNSSQVEADEKFLINLSNLQAGESYAELVDDQAIVTIKDDDPVHVRIDDATVDEMAGTATVYVTLDQPVDAEVSMRYSSSQSSAINDEDFIGGADTIIFQPGEQEKSITFSIINTDMVESDEYFLVRLFHPQAGGVNLILSDSVGYVHIRDDDQANLTIDDLTVDEDIGVASIVVSLDHPVDTAITVNYSTVDQSASNDNDYITQSGTLTINPGELTQTIMIPVVNSDLLELTESFLVQLNNIQASGRNVVFTKDQAQITIQDNDKATISISDISVNEDAGTALLTVELSNPVEAAFSVDFSTDDNSAFDQNDYTSQTGTLTFNAGEQSKTFTIPILDSDLVEVDESFLVNLNNIQSGSYDVVFIDNQAEVTINDDDQAVVTINDITVDETAGTATLTVSLDNPVAESVSVDFQTADDSATSPDDYTSQSGTLTFAPFEVEKTVTISIVDSDLVETDESFLVNLSNLQAGTANVSIADIHGVITILDDDQTKLSISDLTVQEDTGTAYVTVSLDKTLLTPVSIDFSTVGQSATQSVDFEQLTGTLTFDPGELTRIIPIVITDDDYTETAETLLINLFNLQTVSPDVILADSQSVVTIENDDRAKVSVDSFTVNEFTGSAVIQVRMDHPVLTTVTVDYATADDSASNASDYFGKSGTLTFFAGQQTKYVTIPILNDILVEGNETFFVNLTNLQANGFDVDFLNEQAQITIQDNDQTSLSIADLTVDESAETAFVTVTLAKPVTTEVSVDYTTAEQSALGTLDFISTSGTVTFAPGEQSKTIAVSLVNTNLVELDETFLINLSHIQANQADILLADDQAVVTIRNEDQAQISIEDISVNENAGTAVITVSLDAPVDTTVSVDFSTSDQTANNPDDYLSVSDTLIFNPGVLTQSITVTIVDSDYFEINETFQVDLGNVQKAGRNVNLADDQAIVTIQDDELGAADILFRVVNQPTVTSMTGESDSLPENQNIISEWSTYWVEIWVDLTSRIDQGVFSVNADLNYNTAYTSAAEIEFGNGFSQNQAASINDLTGSVAGIYAETTITDLGTDSPVLFARIRFSAGSEDQVPLETEPNRIGPYNLNFELTNSRVELAGNMPVTVNEDLSPGASIYANPFDLNDDDIINYRDLILLVGLYNTVPSESNSEYTWFSDFNQDDRINYRDLIALVGNYNKSKPNQTPVIYPDNYPNAWSDLLLVDTLSTPPVTADSVLQADVESTFDSVIEQTRPALTGEQLETLKHIDIQIVDLGSDTLGRAAGSTIYIDDDAAGYGWFVDTTPTDHSEFTWSSELTLIALPDSDAADGIDLWTVIQHELGHLLGYEHSETGLMQETLAPGIRKLPDWELNFEYENPMEPEAVDPYFSTMQDASNLLPF